MLKLKGTVYTFVGNDADLNNVTLINMCNAEDGSLVAEWVPHLRTFSFLKKGDVVLLRCHSAGIFTHKEIIRKKVARIGHVSKDALVRHFPLSVCNRLEQAGITSVPDLREVPVISLLLLSAIEGLQGDLVPCLRELIDRHNISGMMWDSYVPYSEVIGNLVSLGMESSQLGPLSTRLLEDLGEYLVEIDAEASPESLFGLTFGDFFDLADEGAVFLRPLIDLILTSFRQNYPGDLFAFDTVEDILAHLDDILSSPALRFEGCSSILELVEAYENPNDPAGLEEPEEEMD